jgi:hypothetical protein
MHKFLLRWILNDNRQITAKRPVNCPVSGFFPAGMFHSGINPFSGSGKNESTINFSGKSLFEKTN